MPQLLRIILIHTHLPGVVEIQLDQHTNICGTNASGKTTLQRLVPVFYGEQPNKWCQERGRSSTSFISLAAIAILFMNTSEILATIAWLF